MQMRAGLVASTAVHAILLTWGLWSLSAPKALEAQYAEALPVEVIMSETFEGVKGEAKAPLSEKPAPKPTTRPQTLPMEARNVGDNEVDMETPPVPNEKPVKQEAKPQPKAADLPQETKPEPKPEPPVKVAEKAPTPPPVPTPPKEEPKKQPEPPKVDELAEAIKADATPEPKPVEKPVPKPVVKPQPPKPEVAKAETKPEPKTADSKAKEKPKKDVADKAVKEDSDSNFEDMIAAQLNKAKAAGGGAKRSTETASLGSKVTTGTKLSRSQLGQLDGLIKDKMRDCWSLPAGAEGADGLKVSIRIRFDPSGEIDGMPEITAGGGSGAQRIAAEAAVRAIRRCAPFNLPAEMYAGGWEVTNLNFDPSEMF